MTILSSRENPRVRRWAKLVQDTRFRRAEHRAVIEGPHLLAALLDAGGVPLALLATQAALANREVSALVRRAKAEPVLLSESVFAAVVDSETPQGVAAEVAIPDTRPRLADSEACIFLEGIQDAGNLGTILRSAMAFGVRDVVLAKGCADAWSPKVLRSAAGAHFGLAIEVQADLPQALGRFGGRILCAVPRGGTSLVRAGLTGRIGWVFGGEGQGVSPAVIERADERISVPMASGSESLNVAMAAALCLYESYRSRLFASTPDGAKRSTNSVGGAAFSRSRSR